MREINVFICQIYKKYFNITNTGTSDEQFYVFFP